jgi:hypothetical protein
MRTLYRREMRKCAQQGRYYRRCKCQQLGARRRKKRELERIEEVPPPSKPQQPMSPPHENGIFRTFGADRSGESSPNISL